MRVVQLLPDMNTGGVERGVVELSRALVLRGDESFVISRTGKLTNILINDGGKHICFDYGSKNPLTLLQRGRRLRTILAQLQPDIVHVRSRMPAWVLRYARTTKDDYAVVSTFHGIFQKNFYSAQMADARRIICPSCASMQYVTESYAPQPERLRLIHRGVDFDYFCPTKIDENFCANFRRQHNLKTDKVIALAARITAYKGHDVFLRAVAKMQTRVCVLVIGSGKEKRVKKLQQFAKDLGIGARVRFVGEQKNMREMYHIADLLVSTSSAPEAFGRTVAEALAMECPVVAPAHGGALDIVDEGRNGFLFTPTNVLELTAAMERALVVEWHGLRDSVAAFSLSQMIDKTIAVYQEVMT